MINNLPPGFQSSIEGTSRKPVQLAHFHINGQTCFLSDAPVGVADGLLYDYDPIVESWGTIQDTSNLDNSFNGDSLEVKSIQLKLLITGEQKTLFLEALETGIDNSQLELYQWFADNPNEAPVLIDIMLAQDPIQWSDASSVFAVDCVSVIMRNDPYLWPRPVGASIRDIVIGEMPNMPLIDMQTSVTTTLSSDMDENFLGPIYISNGTGFPSSGVIVIDSENVEYSWITASTMNVVGRGINGTIARPHLGGALLFPIGSTFDYEICAGPVPQVFDLMSEGAPYINPVTFLTNQDPVVARFYGRPPWLKVVPGQGGDVIIPPGQIAVNYGDLTEEVVDKSTGNYISHGEQINNGTSANCLMSLLTLPGAGGEGTLEEYLRDYDDEDRYLAGADQDTTGYYIPPFTRADGLNDYPPTWNVINSQNVAMIENSTGWIEFWFGPPPPPDEKGEFVSAKWCFGFDDYYTPNLQYNQIDCRFEVVLINHNGIEVPLMWWDAYAYFNESAAIESPWLTFSPYEIVISNTAGGTALGPSSWEELEQCKVIMKLHGYRNQDPIITSPEFPSGDVGAYYVHIELLNDTGAVQLPEWKITQRVLDTPGEIPPVQPLTDYQEIVSHFGVDLSDLGDIISVSVTLTFDLYAYNTGVRQDVIGRYTNNPEDNVSLWNYSQEAGILPYGDVTVETGISSWSDLQNARFGLSVQFQDDPNWDNTLGRLCNTRFQKIQWNITYQPSGINTPNEERVVYAQDMTCTVTGNLGKDPTPAEVIRYLIEDHSSNGIHLDQDNFDQRHYEYNSDNYYFNGVFAGDIRLHEALKICLREGMARFLFSEGAIRLLNYTVYDNVDIDYIVDESQTLLRSKKRVNQSTSTITNDFTVLYMWHPADSEFEELVQITDEDSVVKFERHDNRVEFKLIRSADIAEMIAQRNIDSLSYPIGVISFDMFMSAYVLQKGDRIQFNPLFSTDAAVGHIGAVNRLVGQGKNSQVNKFTIYVADARRLV